MYFTLNFCLLYIIPCYVIESVVFSVSWFLFLSSRFKVRFLRFGPYCLFMKLTRTRFYVGLSDSGMSRNLFKRSCVVDYARRTFKGFTCFNTTGGFKGSVEKSVVIEVVGVEDPLNIVSDRVLKEFADSGHESFKSFIKSDLEREFKQQSVLVVQSEDEVVF